MQKWLVWNLLFPLQERIKRHPTMRILKEMEAADHLTPAALEDLRTVKLQRFISETYTTVPYVQTVMKRAGLKPSDIRGPSDLAALPVLRKADVRKYKQDLRSNTATGIRAGSTAGSTGAPLVFEIGRERVGAFVASRQRAYRWWGVSAGDLELALWGSPLELTRQDWMRALRDRALRSVLLSAFELNEERMSAYLDVLEAHRFRFILAYPSALYLLCLHARKQGRDLRKGTLKVAFVTSEMLYPFQRDLIADTLGCPVANGYGGRDSGFLAHECPEGGMHIMADAAIIETVDSQGKPVPAGQPGEIVVTDLYSREAPFLRYATGDIGVLSNRLCACGRPLPLFESVTGRSADSVLTPDGRIMHGQSLVGLISEIEGIESFRIYQNNLDSFHVQIVANERFLRASEQEICRRWSQRVRAQIKVSFEYVDGLSPEASGKFRYIISKVSPPAAQSSGTE